MWPWSQERDRADAVPLDLEAPVRLVAGQLAGAGPASARACPASARSRVRRRVHAVDQPVLAARGEQRVAALQPLAVEGRDHLVVAELLGLVGAACPRSPSSRRRTRPSGSRRAKSRYSSGWSSVCTASRFSSGCSGCPAAAPRRRARRRARAAGPSAGCGRCAPGPRSGPRPPAPRAAARLGRLVEVALGAVVLKSLGHPEWSFADSLAQLLDRARTRSRRRPRAARPPRSRR